MSHREHCRDCRLSGALMQFAFKATVHQNNKNCIIYTPYCCNNLVWLYAFQKTQTNDIQQAALFYTMKVNGDQGLSCSKKKKKIPQKSIKLVHIILSLLKPHDVTHCEQTKMKHFFTYSLKILIYSHGHHWLKLYKISLDILSPLIKKKCA